MKPYKCNLENVILEAVTVEQWEVDKQGNPIALLDTLEADPWAGERHYYCPVCGIQADTWKEIKKSHEEKGER
jgi:hypothetical protein